MHGAYALLYFKVIMKGHKKKGAAVGTGSGIVVGDGKQRPLHLGPRTRLVAIGIASLLIVSLAGITLYVQHRDHLEAQQAKNRMVNAQKHVQPGGIVVTQDQIDQAQNDVALAGTVQSFDGTTIRFLADGSSQAVNLTVTASTNYTQGTTYAPVKASGLKAGSHAVIAYNQKTDKVLNVSYGL